MGSSDKKITLPADTDARPKRPVTEAERRAVINALPKVKLRPGESAVGLVREARGGES